MKSYSRLALCRTAAKFARLTFNPYDQKRPPLSTHVKKAVAIATEDAKKDGKS